jgi:hypothetical protein
MWNIFAQVDAPQSCVQISASLQTFLSNAVENCNSVILKVTEYPSLHNCPTEKSELLTMAGNICITEAASLSSGMSNEAVWVESIVAPFGNLTLKGLIDFVLLLQYELINKKCTVQPESTIAVSCCCRRGGVRQASNFFYYVEVSPLPIIPCWLGILPCCCIWLPHACVRFLDTCSSHWYDFLESCTHESNSNYQWKAQRASRTAVVALLFEESPDFLQSLGSVFSKGCNNATVHFNSCGKVGKCINDCSNKITIIRLCYSCTDIPRGSRCFSLNLLVLHNITKICAD